ncbi:MAG: GlsB/YeaQ/YmgE family stress response membrane protein [Vallitaleaceae bacterium]|jgi:uncharacterized membrane protein YeaQ/YmgE (transglycosylase-associated protein family)|nr:GlsB/YeaQ/YmgE family stress response membrane protein [Vallitaleaceae bacterium]
MDIMDLIIWIITGIVVGWIASKIWKKRKMGLLGYFIVGIVGSFIGGFLFDILGLSFGGTLGSFITAIIGALILLFLLSKIKK